MAKDKRSFIAAIKDTRLRRAGMLIVLPILLAPLLAGLLWVSIGAAVEDAVLAFKDQWNTELNSRAMRAFKIGLKQMWSKEWTTD